jgi:hypothetical protein
MSDPVVSDGRTKTFRRMRPRFRCFDFAISRRRVCYQRSEEMMCDVRDVIYGAIECVFICA